MQERESSSKHNWDIEAIGRTLETEIRRQPGNGYLLSLADGKLTIELYPLGLRQAVFRWGDAELGLFNVARPEVSKDGVFFRNRQEDRQWQITVKSTGKVTIEYNISNKQL